MDDLTKTQTMGDLELSGYPLIDSDPRRLDSITLLQRMRDSTEPLSADGKPFPFLGESRSGSGDRPAVLIVKVSRMPAGQLARQCLREEEDWAGKTGRWHVAAEDGIYRWVARTYIPGTPLNRAAAHASATQRARYARWLLEEIKHWHTEYRKCHLDIKPSNVIVDATSATLIDFETSRDHGSHLSSSLATLSFGSPEQVLPEPGRIPGMASDIFSWGLTVFSLFQPGVHPFCHGPVDRDRLAAVDARVRAGSPPLALDLEAIPFEGLRAAVARALAWSPQHRATAEGLLQLVHRDDIELDADDASAPALTLVQRWLGPAGPLGERTMDAYFHLVSAVSAVTGGLFSGVVLAVLVERVIGR